MARLVRLVPNVDYKKLPLSPVEGSVFLKIDGKLTEPELVKATSFHAETVEKALNRLLELGAVELVDKAKLEKDQTEKTTKAAAGLAMGGNLGKGPDDAYDWKLLSEACELEQDRRKIILDAFTRLDRMNFYELLGLHGLVDKKEVKASYYALAPDFHPDKYFGRKLGTFKAKIEAIFARLTLAHDTLSSKQKRGEYDEYLNTLEQARRASDLLNGVPHQTAQVLAQIEAQARGAAELQVDAKKQSDLNDRRRALAAKLGNGKFNSSGKPVAIPQPSGPPPMDPRQAAEALRVRYEYAKQNAAKAQTAGFVTSGRNALSQRDYAAAANYFRIAASLAPNDADLQREAGEVTQHVAVQLADNFARTGEFEASQERWAEAAVSFSKACNGKPNDPRVHERAAYAVFRTGANARRSVDLARHAVELAPKNSAYRVTLAYCYAGAGLE